jgi:hypothetical protein
LEDFMVPGGWGYRLCPDEKLPVNALRWVRSLDGPQVGRDKFCPTCNLRLALLKVVAPAQKEG